MATFHAQLSSLETETRRILHKPTAALVTVGRALLRIDVATETAEETSLDSRAMARCARLESMCLEMVRAELDWDRSREATAYHARCVAARHRSFAVESSKEGENIDADSAVDRARKIRFVEPVR
ncbi:hypothetical protein KJ359_002682 [Pestalotiopsis sp. 9143b]|nr:hypothetical protein KJ359_002682 [Pestalotiopsis sp. 9143b]